MTPEIFTLLSGIVLLGVFVFVGWRQRRRR